MGRVLGLGIRILARRCELPLTSETAQWAKPSRVPVTSLAALKSSAAKASAMAISLPSSLPCILVCGTADASLLFPVPFGAQPYQWLDARDESTLALTAGGESVQTTAVRHAWA